MTLRKSLCSLIALAAFLAPLSSLAQSTYPSRPIRWVVGTVAGGGSDIVVRLVAEQLSKQVGQPILVDNKPGGGTTIAAEYVARSPADGYTVLTADTGTIVFNTALFKKLSYTPLKDFAPVGMLTDAPLLLVTAATSNYGTAKSAIDAIRANPGGLTYATAGIGSPHHMAMEFLKGQANLKITHVPYKGGAPSIQDTVAGVVPFAVVDSASGSAMIRAGKLRPLATFTTSRIPMLREVPTLVELGYTTSDAPCWVSMVAPAGTPPEVLAKLSQELEKAVASAPVQQRMREFGLIPHPSTAQQMRDIWVEANEFWPPLIRSKGISIH